MKVLLLVWSIMFVLHCTSGEENTDAKLAEETLSESEDNLLTDLEDALNIQARGEPDGDDTIEAVEATGVVESLKRKLEDTAADGDGDDREGPADEDGAEGSFSCRNQYDSCSSTDICCSGLKCRFIPGYYKSSYQCAFVCRTLNQTCSNNEKCCSGLKRRNIDNNGYRCVPPYAPLCRNQNQTCSSSQICCSGLNCLYSSSYEKMVCSSQPPPPGCRLHQQTCIYGSSGFNCCTGMSCDKVLYRDYYGFFRLSILGDCIYNRG